MGGRGASSGYHAGDARDTYGKEYDLADQYRNIKFIKVKSGSSTAPMETRARDRIYVTLGGKNKDTPKTVTYYVIKKVKSESKLISKVTHIASAMWLSLHHIHIWVICMMERREVYQ